MQIVNNDIIVTKMCEELQESLGGYCVVNSPQHIVIERLKYPMWGCFRNVRVYLETKIQSPYANISNNTQGTQIP
jgi:ribosome-interacting GTPase 1